MQIRTSRVPLLVLANLGLLPFAACKQEEAPPVVAPTGSPASSTASPADAGAAVATSAATSTATSTAVATGTAPTSASSSPARDGQCATDQDCGGGSMECAHLAGPVGTDAGSVGHCQHRRNYHLGRPLVVLGEARMAGYARAPQITSDQVAALLDAAREEHASIAAFARTVSELMALGAPMWLLGETQIALGDEIKHTEMTLDLLERATGERPVLGALAAAVAPLRSGDQAAELFSDVFRGGVVGETLAAAHAETQRESATDDALRAFYGTIVEDESRHAALALKTLRWLLAEQPSLASVLSTEKAWLGESGSFEARTLVTPLLSVLG